MFVFNEYKYRLCSKKTTINFNNLKAVPDMSQVRLSRDS